MQLIVDDKKNYLVTSNLYTLSDVLLKLSDDFKSQGRILLGIVLDGQLLAPEELTPQLGNQPIAEIECLELTSASIRELVKESLDEIADVVEELPLVCRELSGSLASDNPASCFGYFNQLLDVWEVLKERQDQVIKHMGLEAASIRIGSISAEAHNAQLELSLAKARSLMEASAFLELSHHMKKDVAPKAESETELIEVLRNFEELY